MAVGSQSGNRTDYGPLIVAHDSPVVGWFEMVSELRGTRASSREARWRLGWLGVSGRACFTGHRRNKFLLAMDGNSRRRAGQ